MIETNQFKKELNDNGWREVEHGRYPIWYEKFYGSLLYRIRIYKSSPYRKYVVELEYKTDINRYNNSINQIGFPKLIDAINFARKVVNKNIVM